LSQEAKSEQTYSKQSISDMISWSLPLKDVLSISIIYSRNLKDE
jgi:hypothetical protein